ncbi:MAG: universal stress protein [Planctomycetota bacterium]
MTHAHPFPFQLAVVGDDGARGGDLALDAAASLMRSIGCRLHVVHSIDVPDADEIAGRPDEIVERREALAQRATEWLRARCDERFGDLASKVEAQVDFGRPHVALLRAARSLDADLVVLGPHRKEHFFDLGGTQRAVFSAAPCHVWSQPSDSVPIERVLAACDLSDRSMAALAVARDVAAHLGVPMCVLHCSPPPAFVEPTAMGVAETGMPTYVVDGLHDLAEERFESKMKSFDLGDVACERRFVVGATVTALEDAREPSDLVVMGTHGHTGISAALLGGVTYSVLKSAKGPVLALRTTEGLE